MRKPRFAVVRSRFNEEVTGRLLESCLKTLEKNGTSRRKVRVVEVPGGFEIPWAAASLARSGRCDAVICLGCVLKGGTAQNDYISQATFYSLQKISIDTGVPCILGVIVPKTWKQAMARTRGDMDRGEEAALAALEMAALKIEGAAR